MTDGVHNIQPAVLPPEFGLSRLKPLALCALHLRGSDALKGGHFKFAPLFGVYVFNVFDKPRAEPNKVRAMPRREKVHDNERFR